MDLSSTFNIVDRIFRRQEFSSTGDFGDTKRYRRQEISATPRRVVDKSTRDFGDTKRYLRHLVFKATAVSEINTLKQFMIYKWFHISSLGVYLTFCADAEHSLTYRISLSNILSVCNGIVPGTRDAFPFISPALGALVWLLTRMHCRRGLESTRSSPTVIVSSCSHVIILFNQSIVSKH